MKRYKSGKLLFLAILSAVVFIHFDWDIIMIFLPWVFAGLIFSWLGGFSKIFYYRSRRK